MTEGQSIAQRAEVARLTTKRALSSPRGMLIPAEARQIINEQSAVIAELAALVQVLMEAANGI